MQKKRTSILILVLALFAADCSRTASIVQAPDQITDVSFKTPEEAITYYLDGVARNDVRKILQACAVNEMGGKFRLDLLAERLGSMDPEYLSPTDYPFYSEINKWYLSSKILSQVKFFSYSLLSSEKFEGTVIPIQKDAERVNRFIKEVDPRRLSKLEVKKISPTNKVMSDSRYREIAAERARSYGADESTERVVLFSFEQNFYYIGFTLLRYGANWKISDQGSPIGDTDPHGTAKKTTEEDFDSLIKDN